MVFDLNLIKSTYENLSNKVDIARKVVGKPLTFTEKILYSHLTEGDAKQNYVRGESYVEFSPDRVAMQDATAQMALLQFMQAGKDRAAVPSSVHCDHLIQAKVGANDDLTIANDVNKEVYDFLGSVANKYGMGFWKPGAGIIHQVVLENYAFPGGMMIGTDSHTPNAGGLGMVAIGVGGADAVDVMTATPWELKFPKIIGIKLTGKMNGWTSAKDVILEVLGRLTVKGGTGAIVEYFGEGAENISCTGKATICNMGAELGATTSNFAYDKKMETYLKATSRAEVAEMANEVSDYLKADAEVYANPEKYYDQVVEIDLNTLEPHLNGPFSPDKAWTISEFKKAVEDNNYPKECSAGLIGSCTNSSYEDLTRAASIAQQAVELGLESKANFLVSPGSEMVNYTIKRDGLIDKFEGINAVVLANACGPCIGQWDREGSEKEGRNSIVTSFNRNFAKRADGNPNTFAFVASPEIVTALAIAGDMTFNPLTDTLTNKEGQQVKFEEPKGIELPVKGFAFENNGYNAPIEDGSKVEVTVKDTSDRLQILTPFDKFKNDNFQNLKLLIKAEGKCTTDHISMAGPWLKYRGHLDNISNNCLIGAINTFNKKPNTIKNQLTKTYGEVPATARNYKAKGIGSIVIGDENYGEGSSREHAAMEPRHLGVRAVIVRSFARIHETNLKKQGVLGLTFANKDDYNKIQEDDTINIIGLDNFTPESNLSLEVKHSDGTTETIATNHTYNQIQIDWFNEGSALNYIKKMNT